MNPPPEAAIRASNDILAADDKSWYENSRPIAEPICATRRTDDRRSSRAISESCNVVGIPTPDKPLSSTLFVSSSMNRGTPSVRSATGRWSHLVALRGLRSARSGRIDHSSPAG